MNNSDEFSDSIDSLLNNQGNPQTNNQGNPQTNNQGNPQTNNQGNPQTNNQGNIPSTFPHDAFEKKQDNESKVPTEILKTNIQQELQQQEMEQRQQENQLKSIIQNQYEQLRQQDIILQKYKNISNENKTFIQKIKNNINQKEILNIIILFILLSTPVFKDILKKYLPLLFSNNNINIFGLVITSIIFVVLTTLIKCVII